MKIIDFMVRQPNITKQVYKRCALIMGGGFKDMCIKQYESNKDFFVKAIQGNMSPADGCKKFNLCA